jgi:hypothetical protein
MKKRNNKVLIILTLTSLISGSFYKASAQTTIPQSVLFTNTNTLLQGAPNGSLFISAPGNPYGYLQIGPTNTTFCNLLTDRSAFWFNVPVVLNNGNLSSYYTSDLSLQTGTASYGYSTRMTIQNSTGFVGIGNTAPTTQLDVNGANSSAQIAIFRNGGYYTHLTANMGASWFNNLVQAGDNGMFWRDAGGGALNGFVIAPWQGSSNGLRIDGTTGNLCVSSWLSEGSLYNTPNLAYGTSFLGFNATRTGSGAWSCASDGVHNGAATIYGDINGNTRFVNISNSSSNSNLNQTLTDAQVFTKTTVLILPTGQVVIGNQAAQIPGPYKLYVSGGIMTELVKVALVNSSSWADYVFADKYKLIPLSDVERFVKLNKHLPEVPSAQEVQANGINVAEMDATLLKKVEELTLYLIDQNKKLDEQAKKIEEQNCRIHELESSRNK